MVIIHGRNVTIGDNRWSANGVGLFTAAEAMEFMGSQMSASMPTWQDNPALRGGLVDSMKH
jgi:acetyltransferase-like isoleucine patch superfamily enzyme